MGRIKFVEVSNTALARRNILHHPPEPPYDLLVAKPTEGIYLGRTEILNVPYYWDPSKITNPHIAIVGITGSGKSYTIKTFLLRASFVWNSNAIIIDWAGEYKDWVLDTNGKVVSLGKGNYINLLDLGGMRPYDRIKQVMRSLEILTDIGQYPEQKRLTEEAIEEAYRRAKFRLDSRDQRDELGRPLEPPTLKDVVRILEEKAEIGEYEFPAELDNAIHRLKKFTRPGEDFFANKSTVSLDELISSGLVDIDLSGLPDETTRALGALTILQFIKEKMRLEGFSEEKAIRLFVVLDEAWKISKDDNSDVVMIVREGRKYRFSLIVASQNPTDISETIFSNVGTTIILKVKFDQYLDYLQSSLAFSDYMRERIRGFGVGQALINVSFHIPGRFHNSFILKRIEGEEPVKQYFIDLTGVSVEGEEMPMSISLKREELIKALKDFGLSQERVLELIRFIEAHARNVGVIPFVEKLEQYGVDRKRIADYLKTLGVDDVTILNIFTRIDAKKSGERIVKLELED